MHIAIDFDKTYTSDPILWDSFIEMCHTKGHVVICATMRHDNEEEAPAVRDSIGKLCKCIFTGRKAKKPFLQEMGYNISIYIDDTPEWLFVDG